MAIALGMLGGVFLGRQAGRHGRELAPPSELLPALTPPDASLRFGRTGLELVQPEVAARPHIVSAPPLFSRIAQLLGQRQGVSLGVAVTPDSPGPFLPHFQLYQCSRVVSSRNSRASVVPDSPPINSMEMHADGTVYVACTAPVEPAWYDTSSANEAPEFKHHRIRAGITGARPFAALKAANVDERDWLVPSQAFPLGSGPAPRWFTIHLPPGSRPADWPSVLRSARRRPLIRGKTPFFPDAGAYCSQETLNWRNILFAPPPEWQTILPLDTNGANGQKWSGPDPRAPGNHPITWDELMDLMQSAPAKAKEILKWRGHPTGEEIKRRRIPWISSAVEGVVTNSFLSGEDFAWSHREAPIGYFLGRPPPRIAGPCRPLRVKNALCNDWVLFVRPDPEYQFLLAPAGHTRNQRVEYEQGNFTDELQGNLEGEIEQWLIPGGYRPEPGDRILMTGRWIVDCGHEDWHTELHPYELVVSSHRRGAQLVAAVVVSGAWPGGTLEFDLWPLARPSCRAALRWLREAGIKRQLTIREALQPPDNPNHLHVSLASESGWRPLRTGKFNDVYYDIGRRLATRYRLWWSVPGELPGRGLRREGPG